MAAEQFVPPGQPESTKSCGGNITGSKKTNLQYIAYAGTDDTSYPDDACGRLVHGNAQIDNLTVNNDLGVTGTITAGTINATSGVNATVKAFNIPHPTKDGKRLWHGCLEGPEYGVYVRGHLTGDNRIILPDYWNGLIDPTTITVSVTQIGSSQDLMVDKIEWGKTIYLKSGNAAAIDCYYTVNATRKDVPPLEIEQDA
tara:strand:- start:63 stop:659 length:597 start_codon:yes stop_codon:yes gene_type:complete